MDSNKIEMRRMIEDSALMALTQEYYNKFSILLDNKLNPNCFKSVFFEILIHRQQYDWIEKLFQHYNAKIPNYKIIQALIKSNNITLLKIFLQHGLIIKQKHINYAKKHSNISDFLNIIYVAQQKCNNKEIKQLIHFL